MTRGLSRRGFLHAVASATAVAPSAAQGAGAPDSIFVNGRVTTLDPARPDASAIAVRGEDIVGVGTDADVMALKGPSTALIDLRGRRVIPGLIDSHMHFVRGGLSYNLDVRWDGVPSIDIAMDRLRQQAGRTPPGQWVRVGGGWSEFQFRERRMPTLGELNAAVPDVPAYVLHFYKSALVNKAGLRALGYGPDAAPLAGGTIARDERGDPTGLLEATPLPATVLAPEARMPALSDADARNSIRLFMRELNRLGMTGVVDPGGVGQPYPGLYGPLSSLAADGLLTLRVAMYLLPQDAGKEVEDFRTWMRSVRVGGDERWFRFVGGGEMLLQAAQDWDLYTTPPVTLPSTLEGPLERVIRELAGAGWSFRQHATFDNTVSLYLDAVEKVFGRAPPAGLRWAVDHAELVSDRNLDRVAALGGGIAVQHRAAFHGELGARTFGAAALAAAPPVRRMLERGIPVGAGTDATRDTSYNPWVCIRWLVTGRTVGGTQLVRPEDCVDLTTALALYTRGSAWFSGEENRKGTLAPGRLADFAALSTDVLASDPDTLAETESVLTVVGGRVVHAAREFATLAPTPLPVSPAWSPNADGRGGYYRP